MSQNTIFYVVFFSQIILISYHFPKLIVNRMKAVLEKYPPSDYPKLYPVTVEQNKMGQNLFSSINQAMFYIGLALILLIIYREFDSNDEIDQIVPFIYFVLQMIPFVLMEFFGFAYFRMMREADKRTKRNADMTPRNLFSFVSPKVFILALATNLTCIFLYLYFDNFRFDLESDALVIILAIILSNVVYATIIYINIKGKKVDPHQSTHARIKQINVVVKSLFYMSIGSSIFLMMIGTIEKFQLNYFEAALMSLYLQFSILIGLGSLLYKLKIEKIDFDVYKSEPSTITQQGE